MRVYVVLLIIQMFSLIAAGSPNISETQKIILSGEILQSINKDENISISNSVIEGDLNSLDNTTEIPVSMRIVNSRFKGSVNFNNVIFKGPCTFSGTVFEKDANFENCIFTKFADFKETEFGSRASFLNAKFIEGTDFGKTKFLDYADFTAANFTKNSYFSEAQLNDKSSFSGAIFEKDSYFTGTKFIGESYFSGTQFNSSTYFKEAQFSNSNFDRTRFKGYAGFWITLFTGRVYFTDTVFEGDTYFAESQFRDDAFFDGAIFHKKLDLSRAKFDRIYIEWNSIKDNLVYDGSAYLSLIRNFKNLESFEDADACYYQYRKLSLFKKELSLSKALDFIAWISCGFGVCPGYTLVLGFIITLLFGSVYWLGNAIKYSTNPKNPDKISLVDSIYFSALIFLTHPPPMDRPVGRWRYIVLVEDLIGWLLFSLFLVTLGNIMIR